jgi:hypothetical protein
MIYSNKINSYYGVINKFPLNKILVSCDLGVSYTRDEKTARNYIEKINIALKKRADFIKRYTSSKNPYRIEYEPDEQGLYSENNFPFIDARSKEQINEIKKKLNPRQ